MARTIGLPLAQQFTLTDTTPYAPFDQMNVDALIRQAKENRKDMAALVEQTEAAEQQRKAAKDERLPTVKVNSDYGDIGTTLGHSHGTVDASASLERPGFQGIRPAG